MVKKLRRDREGDGIVYAVMQLCSNIKIIHSDKNLLNPASFYLEGFQRQKQKQKQKKKKPSMRELHVKEGSDEKQHRRVESMMSRDSAD